MAKQRTKLIAARIESGFKTQDDLINSLRKDGIDIKAETYKNIERGRSKNVDVIIALAIAKKVNRTVEEIFLPIPMQKVHRNKTLPKTG